MKIDVLDTKGKSLRKAELPDSVFGVEMNEHIVHSVVKGYLANKRQGTHQTKTRSHVSGGGKKPFKQKGTGGARQGTTRGPHMPGGAVVHGPQPRSYREKLNRKVRHEALRVVLSDKAKHEKIFVIEDFGVSGFSTKQVLKTLETLKLKSALLADERKDTFLYKSANNIHGVRAVSSGELNAENVLRYESLVITEKALETLHKRLAGGTE